MTKEVNHTVLEYRGDPISPNTRSKFDSSSSLVVPVMPPTLIGVCRLLQIYYVLKVWVEMEKSGDDLHMNFPITIATCPFRIPNSNQQPKIEYEMCCDHVEGGMYIGPEFLLGQVYDGTMGCVEEGETVVLYRPVYVCVKSKGKTDQSSSTRTEDSTPKSPQRKIEQKP
ncbi:arrestin_C domain-containing protein [Trichonephila clavata]|uniref:Arrestin_C domain-containing protein n=1 Tax=Trichonephila clavata TaxID=2740835 RepID=A0A8X6LD70_TRICU|nr:arrestin_C domain-containing protein [Trichonephila clavata]